MSNLFKKHFANQIKQLKKAEEMKEEDKKEETSEEGQEKEANEMLGYDDVMTTAEEETEMAPPAAEESSESSEALLDEIGDAVEEFVQCVVEDVKEAMIKNKTRAEVNNAIINKLNYCGILVKNPYTGKVKPTKFTKKEVAFMNAVVNAATESVEEILRKSAVALKKHGFGKKEAAKLDKRYKGNGYLESQVATPKLRNSYREAALKASAKTRKSNILGLE